MNEFEYSAVDSDGVPQKGVIKAVNRQQAVNVLRSRNYIVTNLNEKKSKDIGEMFTKFKGVNSRDRVVFTRQLSTMISSGLPINQALRVLAGQAGTAYFAGIITDVAQQIDGGTSFHDALAEHPKVFNRLYVSLVRAGELSGNLDIILEQLADTLESDAEFKAKVKGAMIYPAIIVLVMFGVMGIMFVFVIPTLSGLYDDLNAELPITTKMLVATSDAMINFWYIFVLILVGLYFGYRYMMKQIEFQEKMGRAKLKAPVFGKLLTEVQLASFARTLSMLTKAGIPILESLEIARETLGNIIFREASDSASKMIEKGNTMADSFRANPEFPALFSEMLAVGEQSGKVDEVLDKISGHYENEASHKAENLAAAIEPIVMVVLGVMVGFLVISLILPIYSLTSQFV